MKNYKEFVNESDFDDYKDKIEQELKSDVTEEEAETQEIDDKSNDDIVDSVKIEIEKFEERKLEIEEKLKKLEELFTDGDFSEENKLKIEEEKASLEEELEEFDTMIQDSQEKVTKLNGE